MMVVFVTLFLVSCAFFSVFETQRPNQDSGEKGVFSFLDPVSLNSISFSQMTPPATVLVRFEYQDMFKPAKIQLKAHEQMGGRLLFSDGSVMSPIATAVFTNIDSYGTVTFVSEVTRSDYLGGDLDRYEQSVFIVDTAEPIVNVSCYSDYFTLSTLAEASRTANVWFDIRLEAPNTPLYESEFDLELAAENFYFIINGRSYNPTISAGDRFYLYSNGKKAVILLREEFINPDLYFFPGNNEVKTYISDDQYFNANTMTIPINNPDYTPPEILYIRPKQNSIEFSDSPDDYDFIVIDDFYLELKAKDLIQPDLISLYEPSGIKKVEFALKSPDGSWINSVPTDGIIGGSTQEVDMLVYMDMLDTQGNVLPDGIYTLYARAEDNQGNITSFKRYAVFKFGTTPFVPLEVKAYKQNGSESNRFIYGDYAEFGITNQISLQNVTWGIAPVPNYPMAFVPKSPDKKQVYWDNIKASGQYIITVNANTDLGKAAYGEVLIDVMVESSPELSLTFTEYDLKRPFDPFIITVEDSLVGLSSDPEDSNIITVDEASFYASGVFQGPMDVEFVLEPSILESQDGVFTKLGYRCFIRPLGGPIQNYELKESEQIIVKFTASNYIGTDITSSLEFSGR